ncbi:MAG: hypothetical protein KDD94_03105 [Calditrichaeota bacterium]|nr:hypothetical protein [Calditrichota bacterium]
MGNQTTISRLFIILIVVFSSVISQQRIIRRIQGNPLNIFNVADWKTYAGFRSVTDLVETQQYIFFSTDGGGLLRYDKYRGEFISPITSSNGLLSNVIFSIQESVTDTNTIAKSRAQLITDRGKQVIDLSINDNFLFPDPIQFGFQPAMENPQIKRVNLSNFDANFWPPFIVNSEGISDGHFDFYRDVYSYVDADKNYWLLVKNLGLFKAKTDASPYSYYRIGPEQSPLNSITLHNGDLWIGQSQINQKNPILSVWRENNQWENWNTEDLHYFAMKRINKVFSDGQFLWLGSDEGLLKLTTETINASVYLRNQKRSQIINDIELLNNRLLLATNGGLLSYNRESDAGFQIEYKSLSNSEVFSVAVGDSTIMAVTRFGIYTINADYSGVSLLNDELDTEPVATTLVDFYGGKFWFNSNEGIFSYDAKTAEVIKIRLFSPNFNLRINKIIVDGDYVFLGTNKGLIIYYSYLQDWIWFSTGDGLPNNDVRDLLLDGDYLFIVTRNAVTEFRWFDKRRTY